MALKYAPFLMLGCVACSSSSLLGYLMMNSDTPVTGAVCVPEGTPDAKATYKYNTAGTCVKSCNSGYTNTSNVCTATDTSTKLTDGVAHAYDSTKTYACTSGKEIGCANMNSAGTIMSGSGVYTNDACSNPTEFVYCMNPKTTTMAQYSDNTATSSSHRLAATGSRCPTATNANCQDDQSIAGSGTGNTRKITSKVTSRQCVDSSYLYC